MVPRLKEATMRYLVMLMIGFALGAATLAVAAPERQSRPYCTAVRGYADVYSACATIRNWCAWVANANVDDPQVDNLLYHLKLSCPARWWR
jgi:hypothetical protein